MGPYFDRYEGAFMPPPSQQAMQMAPMAEYMTSTDPRKGKANKKRRNALGDPGQGLGNVNMGQGLAGRLPTQDFGYPVFTGLGANTGLR